MNQKLRKLIIAALLSVSATFMFAASGVVVYDKQNEIIFKCLLAKKPVILFEEGGLVIKSNEAGIVLGPKTTNQIGHIEFVSMGDEEQSIIEGIEDAFWEIPSRLSFVFVDGQTAIFDGLSGREHIDVYDLSGRVSSASILLQDARATVSLASLSRGYYIISIDKQSFKVFKK